jgi:hypothetical protein
METIVAVKPAAALAARPRLFAALAEAFPVAFTREEAHASAVIVLAPEPGAEASSGALPTMVLGADAALAGDFEPVRLADAAAVDRRVRGIELRDRLVGAAPPVEGAAVLAAAGSEPVWTRSGDLDVVRCVLPELGDGEVLYSLLSRRAIAAVALIGFLRSLTAEEDYTPPPLRAAFVFDDPNVRWRSYGHIDFRELVAEADEHGYHVAMATIPLDAGRAHGPTRSLFLSRRDRLSLVFHGNDHVKHELLRPRDAAGALALAAQAVRRIERFERRTDIPVDRVMMPPHGLCSEPMVRALGAVGFDALSAIHPLPWTQEPPTAPDLAIWSPAEFVGGCPVIPRIPLTSTAADIALRAFLDHPMIVYGHHEDVAGGLEPLADAARRVNRVGDVSWMSVGEIALGNAAVRLDGTRALVRPYSRRLRIRLPEGAESVTVEAPRPTGTGLELTGWSLGSATPAAFGTARSVEGSGLVELRLHGEADVAVAQVAEPAWTPWPKLRRAGTEMRDRALALRPGR